eukprot:5326183-Pleurochrysis_carterae.AAC.1
MAALKAITLRTIESKAQVDNWRACCAGWRSPGTCGSGCAQFGSGGRPTTGDASGGGERCPRVATGSGCGDDSAPERSADAVEGAWA